MVIGYIFTSGETATLASISVSSILMLFSSLVMPIESMSRSVSELAKYNPFVLSEGLMGNVLISHNWGGLADFVTPFNSILYQANQSIVFNNPHPDPFLYTGLEDWAEPNDHQLMVSLRSVHETLMERGDNLDKRKEHLTNILSRAKEDVKTFDVSFIGPFIKNSLQECYEGWSKNGFVALKEQINEVKKV